MDVQENKLGQENGSHFLQSALVRRVVQYISSMDFRIRGGAVGQKVSMRSMRFLIGLLLHACFTVNP